MDPGLGQGSESASKPNMARMVQGAVLGAIVLLAALHLDGGAPPSPQPDQDVTRGRVEAEPSVVPAALRPASTVTAGDFRAFLNRNRIPHQHLDLQDFVERINQAAARNQVEPAMVLAVIRVESTFQPDAISHKGALGLMQILPGTGQALAEEIGLAWEGDHQLLEPDMNIELGAYYLRKLLDRFDGDRESALEAYFQGPTRLATRRGIDSAQTYHYAHRVLPYWDDLN